MQIIFKKIGKARHEELCKHFPRFSPLSSFYEPPAITRLIQKMNHPLIFVIFCTFSFIEADFSDILQRCGENCMDLPKVPSAILRNFTEIMTYHSTLVHSYAYFLNISNLKLLSDFISSMSNRGILSTIYGNNSSLKFNKSGRIFIFMGDPVEEVLKMKLVIMTLSDHADCNNNIDATFQKFVENKVLKFNILCLGEPTILYYSEWYSEKSCIYGDNRVKRIMDGTEFNIKRYPSKQQFLPNLYGCPVNITLLNMPPAIISRDNTITGLEVSALNMSISKLNGTPKYTLLEPPELDRYNFRNFDYQVNIFGGMMLNRVPGDDHKIFTTGFFGEAVIVVPYLPSRRFSVLFDVVSLDIAIAHCSCVASVLLIFFLVRIYINKQKLGDICSNAFYVIGVLVEQHNPFFTKKRYFPYMIWLLYALLALSIYRASLGMKITNHYETNSILTRDDLIMANNNIVCRSPICYHIERAVSEYPKATLFREKIEKLSPKIGIRDALKKVGVEKNVVLVELEDIVLYELSNLDKDILKNVRILQYKPFFLETAFFSPNNYHLDDMIHFNLIQLRESGITTYLRLKYLRRGLRLSDELSKHTYCPQPITFSDLADIFGLLLVLSAISLAIFIMEIVHYNYVVKPSVLRHQWIFENDFKNVGPKQIRF